MRNKRRKKDEFSYPFANVLHQTSPDGVPGVLSLLPVWRNNYPASARGSFSAFFAFQLVDFCNRNIQNNPDNPNRLICSDFIRQVDNGCDETAGLTVQVADPSSTGRLYLNAFDKLQIDGGYLDTDDDLEALGIIARSGYEQLLAREGPSAMARPCEDPDDEACTSQSCPDILAGLVKFQKSVLRFIAPDVSRKIPDAPPSVLAPNFVEQYIQTTPDNIELGKLLREWIISGYHYAGTASIGTVVDDSLKVIGVEGLYVGDASVLRRTTRVNLMPTALLMGRMAGLKYLEELAR